MAKIGRSVILINRGHMPVYTYTSTWRLDNILSRCKNGTMYMHMKENTIEFKFVNGYRYFTYTLRRKITPAILKYVENYLNG